MGGNLRSKKKFNIEVQYIYLDMNFNSLTFKELERLHIEAYYYTFLRQDFDHQMACLGSWMMYDKVASVILNEEKIDPTKTLYLFTWSPDAKELPDCHFELQHEYNLNYVSEYLKVCECGLACVESTQLGVPHYHGWYQISDNPIKEKVRIIYMKSMLRFGNMKITKSKGHYKIASWSPAANCLHYYKKDLLQSQLFVTHNPIVPKEYPQHDWNAFNLRTFFTANGKRETVADIDDKISLREFYKDFYKNSL